jgi:hypothetical protein
MTEQYVINTAASTHRGLQETLVLIWVSVMQVYDNVDQLNVYEWLVSLQLNLNLPGSICHARTHEIFIRGN